VTAPGVDGVLRYDRQMRVALAVCTVALLLFPSTFPPAISPVPALVAWTTQQPAVETVAAEPLVVNPRVLAGGTALIIASLLFLLYGYRRRSYILYWAGGWITTAASMMLAAPEYPWVGFGYFAYGLSQFTAIVAGLAFVVSADAYRSQPRLQRAYFLVLVPVLIWFALAPIWLGPSAAFAPGHLLIAGAMASAGIAHLWLLRRAWLLGALIVGITLLVLAGLNAWVAVMAQNPHGVLAIRGMFLQLSVYLGMALGMQLMTFEDMTYELRAANRRLEDAQAELQLMVTTDPLTGCGNRRHFDDIIARELRRHERYRIPLSLLFIDIDRFKAVNDTLGHEAGDRVLKAVARFLLRSIRDADYVFRWGGDEFLILISCSGEEALEKAAELHSAFVGSPDAADLPPGVGLSYGAVEVPPYTTDILPLVKLADERMYLNKRGAIQSRIPDL
jgi:diguanylate cyclase (GGDEF)-like protein